MRGEQFDTCRQFGALLHRNEFARQIAAVFELFGREIDL
jgi:hypothetical protein